MEESQDIDFPDITQDSYSSYNSQDSWYYQDSCDYQDEKNAQDSKNSQDKKFQHKIYTQDSWNPQDEECSQDTKDFQDIENNHLAEYLSYKIEEIKKRYPNTKNVSTYNSTCAGILKSEKYVSFDGYIIDMTSLKRLVYLKCKISERSVLPINLVELDIITIRIFKDYVFPIPYHILKVTIPSKFLRHVKILPTLKELIIKDPTSILLVCEVVPIDIEVLSMNSICGDYLPDINTFVNLKSLKLGIHDEFDFSILKLRFLETLELYNKNSMDIKGDIGEGVGENIKLKKLTIITNELYICTTIHCKEVKFICTFVEGSEVNFENTINKLSLEAYTDLLFIHDLSDIFTGLENLKELTLRYYNLEKLIIQSLEVLCINANKKEFCKYITFIDQLYPNLKVLSMYYMNKYFNHIPKSVVCFRCSCLEEDVDLSQTNLEKIIIGFISTTVISKLPQSLVHLECFNYMTKDVIIYVPTNIKTILTNIPWEDLREINYAQDLKLFIASKHMNYEKHSEMRHKMRLSDAIRLQNKEMFIYIIS